MEARRIKCPSCSAVLTLPEGLGGRMLRCGRCRKVFSLPPVQMLPDDTILGWLGGEEDRGEPLAAKTAAPLGIDFSAAGGDDLLPAQDAASGGEGKIRLVRLEDKGALFEFPASRLREESFRIAIPRVCVHCRARSQLSAHVVVFTSRLLDSVTLESEHPAGRLAIDLRDIAAPKGAELLARLPEVPGVPAPGNLPMPYWVCDLCNGVGDIAGQIKVNPATGQGLCRLRLWNLSVALKFFANAGGEGTPTYEKFRRHLQHIEEDRWAALPPVVRHRLEQWFRPTGGERFLAYVPDRSRRRSEDGMAGLAISDTRLVYHRPPLHQELPRGAGLAVQVRWADGREVATIDAPQCKRRSIILDRNSLKLLRRSLSEGNFHAAWR